MEFNDDEGIVIIPKLDLSDSEFKERLDSINEPYIIYDNLSVSELENVIQKQINSGYKFNDIWFPVHGTYSGIAKYVSGLLGLSSWENNNTHDIKKNKDGHIINP